MNSNRYNDYYDLSNLFDNLNNSSNNSSTQDDELSILKTSYTWEINNLQRNYLNQPNSPLFSLKNNNQIAFRLKMSSKNSTSNYNGYKWDILLTLCMQKLIPLIGIIRNNDLNPSKLPVYYRISFLDNNGQKHHSQDGRAVFNTNNARNGTVEEPIEGWEYRISYEYLREMYQNDYNSYLTVRILCEVLILKDSNETLESSFEQKWQNKKPQPPPEIEIPIPNIKANEALDHYKTLLESGTLSDVVIVVGKKEFHVHKAILAARSSVFAAMFSNDLKEKLQNRVVIPDLEVEVCELLLPYIYTGKIPSMKEYALELFFASDKYQLDHLKSICEQNLIKTLSIQTVAHTLLLADMHSAAYLKRKCVEYITRNSEQVMATKGWVEMTKARPELLMELYKDISAKANSLLKRTG